MNVIPLKTKTRLKMGSSLKFGLIGLGGKGADHLIALQSSPAVCIVGLSDSNTKTLANFSGQIKAPVFQDYRDMIRSTQPEAVLVSVPHDLHSVIASEAIASGAHVLIEKPLAINLDEALEILRNSKKYNKKVMVCTQRRFEKSFVLGKSLIPEIGRPFFFKYQYNISCDLNSLGWRGTKKIAGGGTLIDMGYHAVDVLNWYCGVPDEVFLVAGKYALPESISEVEDTAVLAFNYNKKNRLSGVISLSRGISPEEEEIRMCGTEGTLIIKRGVLKLYKRGISDPIVEVNEPSVKAEIYSRQLDHFIEAINYQKEIISSLEENIGNMAIIEAAYLSQKSKKSINPKALIRK